MSWTVNFRVREAHGVFWPQFNRPEMDGIYWLGYRTSTGATDFYFPTLQEAKDYITMWETKGETIHPYP